MPQPNEITPDKLFRLIGTPAAPLIVDVRDTSAPDFDAAFIPGARAQPADAAAQWGSLMTGRSIVVACETGGAASHGVAAWLRAAGSPAQVLEGGQVAWATAGLLLIRADRVPPRDSAGRTVWVTRAPQGGSDRLPLADPSLCRSRRGVSVRAARRRRASGRAVRRDAIRCDRRRHVLDAPRRAMHLRHDGRGVRIGRHRPARPSGEDRAGCGHRPARAGAGSRGLLAISLGLSRAHTDDNVQLDAGMVVYDALYRWCRDARGETHNWTSHQPREGRA